MRARTTLAASVTAIALATLAAVLWSRRTPPDPFALSSEELAAFEISESAYAVLPFPAAKMLVYDWSSVWLNRQRDIDADTNLRQTYGFADGSAIAAPDLAGPFVERATVFFNAPGHTTTNGLQGRDR
jgi:hypothetical protein